MVKVTFRGRQKCFDLKSRTEAVLTALHLSRMLLVIDRTTVFGHRVKLCGITSYKVKGVVVKTGVGTPFPHQIKRMKAPNSWNKLSIRRQEFPVFVTSIMSQTVIAQSCYGAIHEITFRWWCSKRFKQRYECKKLWERRYHPCTMAWNTRKPAHSKATAQLQAFLNWLSSCYQTIESFFYQV